MLHLHFLRFRFLAFADEPLFHSLVLGPVTRRNLLVDRESAASLLVNRRLALILHQCLILLLVLHLLLEVAIDLFVVTGDGALVVTGEVFSRLTGQHP